MVRTKTRPRTLEERYPNGPPDIKLPPKYRIVYNNRIFNDHTGAPALMSWESPGVQRSLPPLASWIFYMTHPDVPRDFDGSLFYSSLELDHQLCRGGSFRYEFFFLPGATAEECLTHFRGEMEVRGTIWRQISKVNEAMNLKKCGNGQGLEDDSAEESASDQDTATDSRLPGLVWPKSDGDCEREIYRGWFFMYPDADIECRTAEQKAREMYLVKFDPIPTPDWDEEVECTPSPMERPIVSRRMKAKDEDGFEDGIFGWMEMRKRSLWEQAADEATDNALELGWKSW
ncbi:hypothetical protein NW754_014785 [Fusarium falciforme]|uniref:Uncharacterized protein n=1 Tax=Fusarium falciforme TaxID=195108 RepID=A0A9W8R0V7_9HYPO|nr:hypothetical protein NW754_014785 [Fusarium falciforme]KAJ4183615.1 hypothetical protein NW755_009649 [Fusarium falciforme]KAJ4246909.1 hypothetical protein NW757_009060 [Fusarium falciforme]